MKSARFDFPFVARFCYASLAISCLISPAAAETAIGPAAGKAVAAINDALNENEGGTMVSMTKDVTDKALGNAALGRHGAAWKANKMGASSSTVGSHLEIRDSLKSASKILSSWGSVVIDHAGYASTAAGEITEGYYAQGFITIADGLGKWVVAGYVGAKGAIFGTFLAGPAGTIVGGAAGGYAGSVAWDNSVGANVKDIRHRLSRLEDKQRFREMSGPLMVGMTQEEIHEKWLKYRKELDDKKAKLASSAPAADATASPHGSQSGGTSLTLELPGFWGHLSYTISGATLNPPTGGDRGDVAGRSYTGKLAGKTLAVSGTARSDNISGGPGSLNYYVVSVTVTAGKESKTFEYVAPKGEKLNKPFSLSVPVATGATSASFAIKLLQLNSVYGTRGWVVNGSLTGASGAATQSSPMSQRSATLKSGVSPFDGVWHSKRQHTDCSYSASEDIAFSTDASGMTIVTTTNLWANGRGRVKGTSLVIDVPGGRATLKLSADGKSFSGDFSSTDGHKGTIRGSR